MADSGEPKSPATEKSARDDDDVVVELPAPNGWRKHFTPKNGGTLKRNEISFVSPTGELFRNKSQLGRYLRKNAGSPKLSEFDWGTGDTPRRSSRFSQKEKTKAQETPEEEKLTKPLKKARTKKTHVDKKDDDDGLNSGATPDLGISFDSKVKEADGGNKETESKGTSELGATESVAIDNMNKSAATLDSGATPDVVRSVDHEVKEAGDKEIKGDGSSELGVNESVEVDDVNKSGATSDVGRTVDGKMKEGDEGDKKTKDEGTSELDANEKSVLIDDVNKYGATLDPGATADVGRSVDSDVKEADEGNKKTKGGDTSELGANESVVADDVNKSASESSFAGVSDGQDSDNKLKGTKDKSLEGKDFVQKEESKTELDKEQEVSPEKEEADGNKHHENLNQKDSEEKSI